MLFLAVTFIQIFLAFADLDSSEEYCSDNRKTVPWLGFLCFFPLVRLGLWVLGESTQRWGASQVAQLVKNMPANSGDARHTGSVPGLERSSGEGNGNPFQYSCLENFMNRGPWWATVHGVSKSQTRLSDFTFSFSGKESTCQCRRHRFDPWVGKILWRRKWQPTPVVLPGKSYGQRSLSGYSPWSHERDEHDFATKQLFSKVFSLL